jgi:hypothetical protein
MARLMSGRQMKKTLQFPRDGQPLERQLLGQEELAAQVQNCVANRRSLHCDDTPVRQLPERPRE